MRGPVSASELSAGPGRRILSRVDRSTGVNLVRNVEADENGGFVSDDSFFDIFSEIEISALQLTLDSRDSTLRLEVGSITLLPPLDTGYVPPQDAPAVPLFEAGTDIQMGWLCHAAHTPTADAPCK